jgi:hypothetical protein
MTEQNKRENTRSVLELLTSMGVEIKVDFSINGLRGYAIPHNELIRIIKERINGIKITSPNLRSNCPRSMIPVKEMREGNYDKKAGVIWSGEWGELYITLGYTMEKRYDLCVGGDGPTGSLTSHRLKKRGAQK